LARITGRAPEAVLKGAGFDLLLPSVVLGSRGTAQAVARLVVAHVAAARAPIPYLADLLRYEEAMMLVEAGPRVWRETGKGETGCRWERSKPRCRGSSSWAPCGSRPAASMDVQIFGVRKSADTRAALRFFAERRVKTHFVDLNERAASPGELRRFAQKFGVRALIDRDAKRFAELGLGSALLSEERWLEQLAVEPLLLRMPLVRHQQQLGVGPAEEAWRAWVAAGKQSA